ncbi:uncharacterized protein LOC128896179 [Hylaeus anthracinus]|uniref:uncharacterized protein LOC128896179 n=1 Tax=Hylaeus anthracinus TaxID=313031 RepID=UPI0023BA29FB|nr:uncharacterized protein LOC128896179 [Hylaeus anthracinus]
MFYQHDGAPAHYAASAKAYLNTAFQDSWIGRDDAVPWPPQSPDLNPLDFFLWGYLKNEVYRQPVSTPKEVVARIHAALVKLQPSILRNVQGAVIRRVTMCLKENGGHVEPFLQ